jgi:hypothetical protein
LCFNSPFNYHDRMQFCCATLSRRAKIRSGPKESLAIVARLLTIIIRDMPFPCRF